MKTNKIITLILSAAIFLLQTHSLNAQIEEAFEYLLINGKTSPNFLNTMKEYWQKSEPNSLQVKAVLENEGSIFNLIEEYKRKTQLEKPFIPCILSKEKNFPILEEDVCQILGDLEKATQNTATVFKVVQRDQISETLKDIWQAREANRKEISSILEILKKNQTATYEKLLTLLKTTRNNWASLYATENDKLIQSNDINKLAFLYCYKATEFINILKSDGLSHQAISQSINFPQLCYNCAQRTMNQPQLKLIITGLRELNLKKSHFLSDSKIPFEEKEIRITIEFLKLLQENFIINKLCADTKNANFLKGLSIIEDGHPERGSVLYKLLFLYKMLHGSQGAVRQSPVRDISNIIPVDLMEKITDTGRETILVYVAYLHPTPTVIASERFLDILEKLESWEAVLERDKPSYQKFRIDNSRYLANFYADAIGNMDSKADRLECICKAATYYNVYNMNIPLEIQIPYILGTSTDQQHIKTKESPQKYARAYLDNIDELPGDQIVQRAECMYEIAKNIDSEIPPLQYFLAKYYVSKVEHNEILGNEMSENEKVDDKTRLEDMYNAVKNLEACQDPKVLYYASMYIVSMTSIKEKVNKVLDQEVEERNMNYMFDLLQKDLSRGPIIKNTGMSGKLIQLRQDYFNPDSQLNKGSSKKEEILFEVDETSESFES